MKDVLAALAPVSNTAMLLAPTLTELNEANTVNTLRTKIAADTDYQLWFLPLDLGEGQFGLLVFSEEKYYYFGDQAYANQAVALLEQLKNPETEAAAANPPVNIIGSAFDTEEALSEKVTELSTATPNDRATILERLREKNVDGTFALQVPATPLQSETQRAREQQRLYFQALSTKRQESRQSIVSSGIGSNDSQLSFDRTAGLSLEETATLESCTGTLGLIILALRETLETQMSQLPQHFQESNATTAASIKLFQGSLFQRQDTTLASIFTLQSADTLRENAWPVILDETINNLGSVVEFSNRFSNFVKHHAQDPLKTTILSAVLKELQEQITRCSHLLESLSDLNLKQKIQAISEQLQASLESLNTLDAREDRELSAINSSLIPVSVTMPRTPAAALKKRNTPTIFDLIGIAFDGSNTENILAQIHQSEQDLNTTTLIMVDYSLGNNNFGILLLFPQAQKAIFIGESNMPVLITLIIQGCREKSFPLTITYSFNHFTLLDDVNFIKLCQHIRTQAFKHPDTVFTSLESYLEGFVNGLDSQPLFSDLSNESFHSGRHRFSLPPSSQSPVFRDKLSQAHRDSSILAETAEQDLARLQQALHNSENKIKSSLQDFSKEKQALREKIQSLERTVEALEQELMKNQKPQAEAAASLGAKDDYAHLKIELENARTTIQELQNALSALEASSQQQSSENQRLISQLNTELIAMKQEHARALEELTATNRDLQEEIDQLKMRPMPDTSAFGRTSFLAAGGFTSITGKARQIAMNRLSLMTSSLMPSSQSTPNRGALAATSDDPLGNIEPCENKTASRKEDPQETIQSNQQQKQLTEALEACATSTNVPQLDGQIALRMKHPQEATKFSQQQDQLCEALEVCANLTDVMVLFEALAHTEYQWERRKAQLQGISNNIQESLTTETPQAGMFNSRTMTDYINTLKTSITKALGDLNILCYQQETQSPLPALQQQLETVAVAVETFINSIKDLENQVLELRDKKEGSEYYEALKRSINSFITMIIPCNFAKAIASISTLLTETEQRIQSYILQTVATANTSRAALAHSLVSLIINEFNIASEGAPAAAADSTDARPQLITPKLNNAPLAAFDLIDEESMHDLLTLLETTILNFQSSTELTTKSLAGPLGTVKKLIANLQAVNIFIRGSSSTEKTQTGEETKSTATELKESMLIAIRSQKEQGLFFAVMAAAQTFETGLITQFGYCCANGEVTEKVLRDKYLSAQKSKYKPSNTADFQQAVLNTLISALNEFIEGAPLYSTLLPALEKVCKTLAAPANKMERSASNPRSFHAQKPTTLTITDLNISHDSASEKARMNTSNNG